MIRQAGLMLPRKEYKEPLYRLRQNEYCILLMFEGNLGNKPINRYVCLLAQLDIYTILNLMMVLGFVLIENKLSL